MRFGLLVVLLVGLFSVALRFVDLNGVSEPRSPENAGEVCEVDHVIVLDRTTVLDVGRSLLVRGAETIVKSDIYGVVSVHEIRDTSTGYELLREFQLGERPLPPSEPRIQNCPTVSGAYPDPSDLRERNACLADNKLNLANFRRDREVYLQEIQAVSTEREELRQFVSEFAQVDSPTSNRTVIRDSLREILRARCPGGDCALYLFSDMLDTEIKNSVVRSNIDLTAARELGVQEGSDALAVGDIASGLVVIGWGIGRSDIADRRSLTAAQTEALRAYWQSLLNRWGASSSYFGLEFPSTVQVERAISNLCSSG
jgi:hypothetical protein